MDEPAICVKCKYHYRKKIPILNILGLFPHICMRYKKTYTDFVTGEKFDTNKLECNVINDKGECEGFDPK